MASRVPRIVKTYRWKELGLCIIPFTILVLGLTQLLLVNQLHIQGSQTPFTTKILPTVEGLIPVIGLIAVLIFANVLLSFFFPRADQIS